MRAAAALILVGAAGVALATAGGASDLRAVHAPAGGIEAPSGALLAAAEFDGPARLLWVRPGTLRPAVRPLTLDELDSGRTVRALPWRGLRVLER